MKPQPRASTVEQSFVGDSFTLKFVSCKFDAPVYREVNSRDHRLVLWLGPLPSLRDCYFPASPQKPTQVGTVSLCPANFTYISNIAGGSYRWMEFTVSPEYLAERTDLGGGADLRFAANIMGTPINMTLPRLAAELAAPGFCSNMLLNSLGESILVDIIRYTRGTPYDTGAIGDGLTAPQLQRLKEYVEESEKMSPTVREIAQAINVSPRHLTRKFKVSTGATIHAYVTQVRLRKAIHLLINTDLSAKEISYRLGFAAPWGFSAAFRTATGHTPTQFRRHYATHGDLSFVDMKQKIL